MLKERAEAGRASRLASFPPDALKRLGVSGNGHLDGHSEVVKWVRGQNTGLKIPAASEQFGGQTAPSDGEGLRGETLHGIEYRNGVARGVSAETTERLTGPVQFVRILMEFWRLDMHDAVRLLGYDSEDSEHVSAVLNGKEKLRGRDLKDRIAHLYCIRRTLCSLFRDQEVENDWLREQHSMLNEKSPLSLMLEGSMEDLLLAREYVESAAGLR